MMNKKKNKFKNHVKDNKEKKMVSKNLKEMVVMDSIIRMENKIGSAEWLNTDGTFFNHSLRLINFEEILLNKICKDCSIDLNNQNLLNLDILIANLIYNDNKLKPTVVSMSSNYWTKTRYNKVSYHIIDIIYKLNKMGFIFLKRGFQNNIERKRTRIWATEKLTSITSDLKTKVIYEPVELIELKDNYGNLIDYIDTYKTRRIRSILQKINSLNNRCDITLRNKNLSTSLVAIFKNNFNLYGRLHTRTKNHYQGIPKKERAKIKINGESVIELDFVGLHPHLLYAQENIQLGWDPYSIVIDDPFLRDFLKTSFLSLINSNDVDIVSNKKTKNNKNRKPWKKKAEHVAECGINQRIGENPSLADTLKNYGISTARDLIKQFNETHKPISHHFGAGNNTGLRLMNKDSKIAIDIINHFESKNIPILNIHDSFIVQKKFEDELKTTMDNVYCKHTKGFKCPIK